MDTRCSCCHRNRKHQVCSCHFSDQRSLSLSQFIRYFTNVRHFILFCIFVNLGSQLFYQRLVKEVKGKDWPSFLKLFVKPTFHKTWLQPTGQRAGQIFFFFLSLLSVEVTHENNNNNSLRSNIWYGDEIPVTNRTLNNFSLPMPCSIFSFQRIDLNCSFPINTA